MYCHSCGEKNSDAAKFCHKCGARLASKAVARSASASSPAQTGEDKLKNQAIYKCKACGHEGTAYQITRTRWRWWHYLTSLLFFPFGLILTIRSTSPTRECAECHSTHLKRLRYQWLPYAPLNDPDALRNHKHHTIAVVITLALAILGYVGNVLHDAGTPTVQSSPTTTNVATVKDPVLAAQYDEGLKAGYTDGRAANGKLGDSYSPPAPVDWKTEYFLGYVDGFLTGCDEGNFDCTDVRDYFNQVLGGGTAPDAITL